VLRDIGRTNMRIAQAKVDIERQKMLHPVYEEILGIVSAPLPQGLPMPDPEPLSEADISGVETLLNQAAEQAGFVARDITPDPSSLVDDARYLLVNASFQGEMAGLRSLMVALGAIPSLTHVEQMRIEENLGKTMFHYRLWMALEKQ
jgi:hypothetical protein